MMLLETAKHPSDIFDYAKEFIKIKNRKQVFLEISLFYNKKYQKRGLVNSFIILFDISPKELEEICSLYKQNNMTLESIIMQFLLQIRENCDEERI